MLCNQKSKFLILQIILIMFCTLSYGQNTRLDSAYYYFKQAKKFDFENKHFKAYENYVLSRNIYLKLNQKDSLAKCNMKLYDLIHSQNNLDRNAKPYLDDYYAYALEKKDSLMLLEANNSYAAYFWDQKNTEKTRKYYNQSLKLTDNKKLRKYKATIFTNLAYLYTERYQDSASYYFKKALSLYTKENRDQLLATYINYANFFQKQGNYKNAIIQLKKAEAIEATAYQLKYNRIIYGKFANYYQEIGDYQKAYQYYEKYNIARDSLNNTAQNIAISDLDKKYKTAEKEKENLQLKQENIAIEQEKIKNQNFLIAAILSLILVSIIATLIIKNSIRKRELAEQEKQLETQKNLTLLKEQEIKTINAMVEGQEKERKQIAEDLHDNLGSVLATLKLHFDNLKINRENKKINQDELFNKTEQLIDDTYLKVRSIAHAKNAGVIANQSLLLAVQMMAEKISSADKLKIEVIHFGLDKRLENNLELTVFRIIQELITNIIKHADAKNVTINISLFDKTLNIIVEDDGLGFDINTVELKDGIGIRSIKTRIQHLKGSFTIDTTIGKGSSMILDIPMP
jgi:signal transduction histidine kinase